MGNVRFGRRWRKRYGRAWTGLAVCSGWMRGCWESRGGCWGGLDRVRKVGIDAMAVRVHAGGRARCLGYGMATHGGGECLDAWRSACRARRCRRWRQGSDHDEVAFAANGPHVRRPSQHSCEQTQCRHATPTNAPSACVGAEASRRRGANARGRHGCQQLLHPSDNEPGLGIALSVSAPSGFEHDTVLLVSGHGDGHGGIPWAGDTESFCRSPGRNHRSNTDVRIRKVLRPSLLI